jgi:hypothetical protein
MLRGVAAAEAAGGVAAQLKMQRSRARMQADELMVQHYEEIGRDLQWVVRGGGDQVQRDAAVAMLQKLHNMDEFKRREGKAGTSIEDMGQKFALFADYTKDDKNLSAVKLRAEFERVMLELQSSCPTVITLTGDNAGDASCCLYCECAQARRHAHAPAANMLSAADVARLAHELANHSGLQGISLAGRRCF